jgi:hypothetical protein
VTSLPFILQSLNETLTIPVGTEVLKAELHFSEIWWTKLDAPA